MDPEKEIGSSLRGRKLYAALPEIMITGVVMVLENVRTTLVHPEAGVGAMLRPGSKLPPAMLSSENHPFLYSILQHSGNFFEGYFYPFAVFHSLNIMFANKLPEKLKIGVAILFASSALFYAEGGIRPDSKSDFPDMPAGVAGMAAWYGSRRLFRRLEGDFETVKKTNMPAAKVNLVPAQAIEYHKRRKKKRKSRH